MSKYYITRDKNNSLFVFNDKPSKCSWDFWDNVNDCPIKIDNNLFPEVKWEDKEPKVLTIEESPWIKVEERLPVNEEEVLQLNRIKTNGKLFCMINSYKNGKWLAYAATDYDTIAWMSIPKFNP